MSIVGTSYVGYLNFIKNKSHRDSLKTPFKLDRSLDQIKINQFVKIIEIEQTRA